MTTLPDRDFRRHLYQAVDVQQGVDERQQEFYVPIYERPEMMAFDLVPKMADAIDLSAGQTVQLLSGFRGCGKTSELMRLQKELRLLGYEPAYMDIEDYFNTRLPLDLAKFPIALAAGFARAVDHDPNGPRRQRFMEFLSRVRPELKATFGAAGAGVEVSAVVRDDTSFAAAAVEAFNSNRRVLRRELHSFFADVLDEMDGTRPVVFIVDSIDHWRGASDRFDAVRDSVEEAFTELADDLRIPGLHVIYTVPIYLDVPGLGVRYDVVNVKLADRQGARFQPGHDALRDVLRRRTPDEDLDRFLPPSDVDRLIGSSGGHFRDLLRLTRETLLSARVLPGASEALAKAEMTIREGYSTTLTQEQIDLLKRVHATKTMFIPRQQTSDEAALVSLGAVLRYPNAEATWHDVHPLLRSLLA